MFFYPIITHKFSRGIQKFGIQKFALRGVQGQGVRAGGQGHVAVWGDGGLQERGSDVVGVMI